VIFSLAALQRRAALCGLTSPSNHRRENPSSGAARHLLPQGEKGRGRG